MPVNVFDVIALIVFGLYIARSWYTGLWPWVNGLLSLVLGMYAAFFAYPLLKTFFTYLHVPIPAAYTISFVLVLLIVQGLLSSAIQAFYEQFPLVFYERKYTRVIAFIPAGIEGLMAVVLLVIVTTVMPVPMQIYEAVQQSYVGGAVSKGLAPANHFVNTVTFGHLDQALVLLASHSEDDERPKSLPVKPGTTTEDVLAEQEMFTYINQQRLAAGLAPLTLDTTLTTVARAHSSDMWTRQYFAHVDPSGIDPFGRMEAAGVVALSSGENIALAPSVDSADTGFMNSLPHRQNILSPSYHKVGIGVIDAGTYGKMFTQDFTN